MRKKSGKIMIIFGCVIVLVAIVFLIWALISSGKIRTYDGEMSISEKYVMDVNGVPNGFFINGKDVNNPVLLLVSSGPGSDDYVFTDQYKDMNLEEYFTVVYWDYRGMGIAYRDGTDISQITMDNLLQDAHEVTQYLKNKFSKQKIYLMGFSGGTHIALKAAEKYPEDYVALIQMAQAVTDSDERDTLMYNFMNKVFTEKGNTSALGKLEASVEHLDSERVKAKVDWHDYVNLVHDAGGGTIKDKTEFSGIVLPIIFSHSREN